MMRHSQSIAFNEINVFKTKVGILSGCLIDMGFNL